MKSGSGVGTDAQGVCGRWLGARVGHHARKDDAWMVEAAGYRWAGVQQPEVSMTPRNVVLSLYWNFLRVCWQRSGMQ